MNQRGMSAIDLLISTMVLGMVGVAAAGSMTTFTESAKYLDTQTELMSLRTTLLERISCEKTVAALGAGGCTGGPVEVRNRKSQVVVAKTSEGSKVGKWTLRASCDATTQEVLIQAAQLKDGQDTTATDEDAFVQDKFTGKRLSWTNPDLAIFGTGMGLCHHQTAAEVGSGAEVETPTGTIMRSSGTAKVTCSDTYKNGSATCATGSILGGGARCLGASGSSELNVSYPDPATNSWIATCCDAASIEVYAICSTK